ncbi:hypothetical protein TNCT_113611 [Trichonephila clavata]|uniref:Uncharacterized protein n=1 Tax=Trichonephila clavata TaxID=2740835 RepID=A0A8X6FFW4_TRICU|nr:hypothetical protein TNCT_113611 [Trichonephila clavata]
MIRRRCRDFSEGRQNVHDQQCRGHPSIVDVGLVEDEDLQTTMTRGLHPQAVDFHDTTLKTYIYCCDSDYYYVEKYLQ